MCELLYSAQCVITTIRKERKEVSFMVKENVIGFRVKVREGGRYEEDIMTDLQSSH